MDFSYRIEGMFALILPESPAGERAMGQLLRMTDGTAKVFTFQLDALKADLHAAGYTIRKRKATSHTNADALLAELSA